MKKKVLPFLTVLFAVLMVVFFCLWQKEANDRSEMELLCKANAGNAAAAFTQWETTGSEASYRDGLGCYYAFLQGWSHLDASNNNTEYLFYNMVYGYLRSDPEECKNHLPELISLMELLSEDPFDPNGPLRASELANALEYVE